jgi:hypothetical protein
MTEIALEKRFSEARDALAALKSGNIQGANLQIETVRKIAKGPPSRIQFSKSATELNIKIPSTLVRKPFLCAFRGISLLLPFLLCFVLILLLGWLTAFIIPLGLWTILASIFVTSWFKCNKITFNQNYFKLEHQIFGWSYFQQTGKISEILGIFINTMGMGSEIRISSGNDRRTYFYVLANGLKDVEAAWLAQEIQDWLNLR